MDLKGKVAIVTGGARGIGYAYCVALLDKNAKVCIADILVQEGQNSSKALGDKYGKKNVTFVKCDVTSDKEFENAFIECQKYFGGTIDILVNNAGIVDEQNYPRLIEINFTSVVRGIHLAFKHLGKPDDDLKGAVVNTSSILGLYPTPFLPVYCGTKHAVIGITRSYADPMLFNIHRVKVNAVCPLFHHTDLWWEIKNKGALPEDETEVKLTQLEHVDVKVPAAGLIKILEEGKNGAVIAFSSNADLQYIDCPNYIPDVKL